MCVCMCFSVCAYECLCKHVFTATNIHSVTQRKYQYKGLRMELKAILCCIFAFDCITFQAGRDCLFLYVYMYSAYAQIHMHIVYCIIGTQLIFISEIFVCKIKSASVLTIRIIRLLMITIFVRVVDILTVLHCSSRWCNEAGIFHWVSRISKKIDATRKKNVCQHLCSKKSPSLVKSMLAST